jgi:hypothetical protein
MTGFEANPESPLQTNLPDSGFGALRRPGMTG